LPLKSREVISGSLDIGEIDPDIIYTSWCH
jgi:hypothetical protein